MPSVSILLPTFNGSNTIRDAIQSCRDQTHTDWRLIVVDNKSTDDTVDIVKSIISVDRRIELVQNEKNIGSLKNYRLATDFVKTDYFSFFADDDFLEPLFLKSTLNGFTKFPDILMVCGRTGVENVKTGEVTVRNGEWSEGFYESGAHFKKAFNDHFTWTGILFSSKVLALCGKPGRGSDPEYFTRVATAGDFLVLKNQTALWRINGGGFTDSIDEKFKITLLISRTIRALTYHISVREKAWAFRLLVAQTIRWISNKVTRPKF